MRRTRRVTLNTNASPPDTIGKDTQAVATHQYEIRWVPASGQSGWTFAEIIKRGGS